jgi:hypothetical protein
MLLESNGYYVIKKIDLPLDECFGQGGEELEMM